MLTSIDSVRTDAVVVDVHFDADVLCVVLSDGRQISLPMDQFSWLRWLAQATPDQRAHWCIEPGGYAVYWEDLDDGVEVCHLLDLAQLA